MTKGKKKKKKKKGFITLKLTDIENCWTSLKRIL